jgi:hypothetical protein
MTQLNTKLGRLYDQMFVLTIYKHQGVTNLYNKTPYILSVLRWMGEGF